MKTNGMVQKTYVHTAGTGNDEPETGQRYLLLSSTVSEGGGS